MVEYVSVWSLLAKSSFNVLVASTPVWHEMTTKMTSTIIIKIVLVFPKPIFENSSYISCCGFWTFFSSKKKVLKVLCYLKELGVDCVCLWENMNLWGMLYISDGILYVCSLTRCCWWLGEGLTCWPKKFWIFWISRGVWNISKIQRPNVSKSRKYNHSNFLNCPLLKTSIQYRRRVILGHSRA
jgi:hypothetical protein